MEQDRFAFGENWQAFLALLTEERIQKAVDSIREFTGLADLTGRSVVDIGCGSGLFSLAIHRLGAERLVSFDYDPASVACCQQLHERAGRPANWTVCGGSALDKGWLTALGQFDLVYSWGVLHHTGDMWPAIANAAAMVTPGGHLYITLYNKTRGLLGSRTWAWIKRFYNRSPQWRRTAIEYVYIAYFFQSKLLRFRNPWRHIRDYKRKRGMDWRTDIRDWIGGYPYEYASVQEVFDFLRKQPGQFVLENLKTNRGLGTNGFLFRRLG